jgi:hypothetical protein
MPAAALARVPNARKLDLGGIGRLLRSLHFEDPR